MTTHRIAAMLLTTLLLATGAATAGNDGCAGGRDAGNDRRHASQLETALPSNRCTGSLDARDTEDWYFKDRLFDTLSIEVYRVCAGAGLTLTASTSWDPGALHQASGGLVGVPGQGEHPRTAGPGACVDVGAGSSRGADYVRVHLHVHLVAGAGSYTVQLHRAIG